MATNGYENSERHHQINHSHDSNLERKASISQKILTKTMIGALIICGIIVVCIQAYVFSNYTQVYDGLSLPSETFGTAWDEFYTSMILSSSSANILVGFFLICILQTWKRLMMIVGSVFTVVAGIGSILAGLVAIAEIIKLYDESEIPLHVCVASENLESLSKKCDTWWWLELVVVIFSGFAMIANFTCFVVLCIDLCSGNYTGTTNRELNIVPGSKPFPVVENWPAYDEHHSQPSQLTELWLPRVPNSLQHSSSFVDNNQLNYSVIESRKRVHQQPARKTRIPPQPTPLQSRPSLPIVIRQKTDSRYFY